MLEHIEYNTRSARITITIQDFGIPGAVWNVWGAGKGEQKPLHNCGVETSIGAARVMGHRIAEDFGERLGTGLGVPAVTQIPSQVSVPEKSDEEKPEVSVGLGRRGNAGGRRSRG